jgi:hypothetical protein
MSATYALIIGISDYSYLDLSSGAQPGQNDLTGAQNDLRSMAMLIRMMDVPADNIRVLSNPLGNANGFEAVAMGRDPVQNMNMAQASFGPATQQGILEGLQWLASKLQKNGSQGIIYYAGHSVVTQSGHPALCPADVRLDPAHAQPVLDGDFWRYAARATLLSAIDEVTGPEPEKIHAFLNGLAAHPGALDNPRAGMAAVAESLGYTLPKGGVTRMMKYLGNMGEGLGSSGWTREKNAKEAMKWAMQLDYTPEVIQSVLHADPFADGDSLRGLISFNKAFFQMMRDVPEESRVSIVLETCLKESPGRALNTELYNDHTGLPLAHGNMALLSSCAMGQASKRAVFDNRWHGAFTWALVTVLSQLPVKVYKDGRAFGITTDDLVGRIYALLGLVGNEQRPFNSAQGICGQWEFFGGPAGTPESVLMPVRLKEEIDAGDSGHIYELESNGAVLGWLLRTKDQSFSAAGHTWQPNQEYWIWNGSVSRLTGPNPATAFNLRRPTQSQPPSAGLAGWLNAQGIPQNALIQGCPSAAFAPSSASPGANAWNVAQNGVIKARVKKLSNGLQWFRPPGQPGLRLNFGNAMVLAPGQVVQWVQAPPPPGVSFSHACEDSF